MFWTTRIPQIAWNPWAELEEAHARLWHGMAEGATAYSSPPVEVWLKDDAALVRALLPGVNREDVDLSVEGGVLTLKIAQQAEAPKEDARWHRRERVAGQVTRTLELPFEIEADRVRATLVNGRLEVELPRAERDKPRRVAIQTN